MKMRIATKIATNSTATRNITTHLNSQELMREVNHNERNIKQFGRKNVVMEEIITENKNNNNMIVNQAQTMIHCLIHHSQINNVPPTIIKELNRSSSNLRKRSNTDSNTANLIKNMRFQERKRTISINRDRRDKEEKSKQKDNN